MKKIISISILIIYMVSCTEFNQLLKIPLLIEHFIEHKEVNKDLSICDFVHIHYMETQHFDGDYDQDMRLPFKSIDGNTIHVIAFIPFFNSFLKIKSAPPEDRKFYSYKEIFIKDAYLSSIWQPPKFS